MTPAPTGTHLPGGLPLLTRRRLLAVGLLVVVPGWLFVVGPAQRVWTDAAVHMLGGQTLYVEGDPTGTNPHTTNYVYLPVFAVITSLVLAIPYHLASLVGVTGSAFSDPLGYLITGGWGVVGYLSVLTAIHAYFEDAPSAQWWATVLVGVYPVAVVAAMFRGSDLVVAALMLAVVIAIRHERWIDAGLAASLATFKFTGLPVAVIVAAYLIKTVDWTQWTQAAAGGLMGQLPNAVYYLVHPSDFWLVVERRGALSTYAYRITEYDTYLQPLRWSGLEDSYATTVFPVVVAALTIAGVLVAVRVGVLEGMMLGYASMSYLVPAESRLLPFVVLLFVVLVQYRHRSWARAGALAVIILSGYTYVFQLFPPARFTPLLPGRLYVHHTLLVLHGALYLACLSASHPQPVPAPDQQRPEAIDPR